MDIRELRDRADIHKVIDSLGVEVKQLGSTYLVKCPCHEDTHPSAFFKEGDNYIYCNVCRKNINALDMIMSYRKIEFKEALQELSCIEGVSVDKNQKPKDAIKASEYGFLGIKTNYQEFMCTSEYKDLVKCHILYRKKRIADIERFLQVSMPAEKKIISKIEKQLGV